MLILKFRGGGTPTFDLAKFKRALDENNIEELSSGYQLDFIGRNYARKQAGERPTTVIVPDKTANEEPQNKNSKNLFLTGDNLEVLRHLQQNYYKKIDFIYIDPPYNTGSDGFVYPDSFEYDDETLKNMFGLNDEDLARMKSIQGKSTHSAWLTFMYPRLYLAKKLLTDEGVIFVSIDDNEQANLKLLMDDIFGEGNFVQSFIWHKKTQPSFLSKEVANIHEYIVAYRKNKSLKLKGGTTDPNKLVELLNISNPVSKRVLNKDDVVIKNGEFTGKLATGEYGNNKLSIILLKDVVVKSGKPMDDLILEGRFKWAQSTIDEAIDNGGNIEIKSIKTLRPTLDKNSQKINIKPPVSILSKKLDDIPTNTDATNEIKKLFEGVSIFTNPKPSELLRYLIESKTFSDKNAKVLDFFAGSSTTADAVMQLNAEDGGNRQFIMCTLPEKTYTVNSNGKEVPTKGGKAAYDAGFKSIDEISRERIRRASAKIQEEAEDLPENFDGGFKHFRFVQPNKDTLDQLEFEDAIQQDLFDDMISSFSSASLNLDGEASGFDTILQTYLVKDNYPFDVQMDMLDIVGVDVPYVNEQRIYIITNNWEAAHTRELVNAIGTGKLIVQTIVVYGHTISMESLRELEIALKQLEQSVDMQVRY